MDAKTVLIAQSSTRQEEVWRAALTSQGLNARTIARGASLAGLAADARRGPAGDLLLVDLAELAAEEISLAVLGSRLRERRSGLALVATLGARFEVADAERRWARAQGAADLFPGLSPGRLERDASWLGAVLAELGRPAVDVDRLRAALGGLRRQVGDAALAGERLPAALGALGVELDEVAARARAPDGVECRDRRYRLKQYPHCFAGSEAIDWLARTYALDRETALELGQALLERGVFQHVAKAHPLRDGRFFYRFAGAADALDAIEIDAVVERMRGAGGVPIADRTWRGRKFTACFVGKEAVDWMTGAAGLARADAESLGQRLVDLHLVRHVVDEHDFIDGHYFYRFAAVGG